MLTAHFGALQQAPKVRQLTAQVKRMKEAPPWEREQERQRRNLPAF